MTTGFTILDEGQPRTLAAAVDGDRVTLTATSVADALGWKFTTDGLCHGDVCIPTRAYGDHLTADGLDLIALAAALDRPVAVEPIARVAALGTSVGERAQRLHGLTAPDLALTDLDGRPHRLDELRARKVFLLAFASW